MKIAFYSVFPLEYYGGLEKYYIQTTSYLRRHFNDEISEITIINMTDNFYVNMCKVFRLFLFQKIEPTFREKSDNIISQLDGVKWEKVKAVDLKKKLNEYDTIYTKNEILELFLISFISFKKNIKIIAGVHTPPVYPNERKFFTRIRNFLYNSFIYKILARRVDTFHVLNNFCETLLSQQFPNKQVQKIYNPFNFDEFATGLVKKKRNVNKRIIWVGRLTEQKGIKDLIHIIESFNANDLMNKGVIWTIVGDGEFRTEIEKLGIKYDNIEFLGHVDNKKIPELLNSADLYVSTSKWEGFPFTVLEAQAVGLPVIAFDIDGINDIIENGVNGYLVKDREEFILKIKETLNNNAIFSRRIIQKKIKLKFDYRKLYVNLYNLLRKSYESR